jgi:hypothetical protein
MESTYQAARKYRSLKRGTAGKAKEKARQPHKMRVAQGELAKFAILLIYKY